MKQPVRLLVLFSLILGCAGGEGGLKEVPRNRTMILDCLTFAVCAGQIKDYDTFNPFIPGNTAPTGSNFLYEPLYFYNAFKETRQCHSLDRREPRIQRGLHRGNGEDPTRRRMERWDAVDGV